MKGSFTGAIRDKIGRFEAADGGTIFLDEIGTMEPQLQVKLLRVLQEREFERVGDTQTVKVDVRVIAATNVDLQEEVAKGNFREDLFYRLNVVSIYLPPLRNRREDIPRLIDYFLDKYNAINDRRLRRISRDMLNVLLRYPWPGNVRELENAIERAVVLSNDEDFTEDLLPLSVRMFAAQRRTNQSQRVDRDAHPPPGRPGDQRLRAARGRDLPARDRPDRARPDRPRPGQVRRREDQGRRLPGHQPQHAEQEGEGPGDRGGGLTVPLLAVVALSVKASACLAIMRRILSGSSRRSRSSRRRRLSARSRDICTVIAARPPTSICMLPIYTALDAQLAAAGELESPQARARPE